MDRESSGDERDPQMPPLVGPVLLRGPVSDVLIAAIRARHPDARVLDRGAYWRVQVPGSCQLQRADVEARLGRGFALPADLEEVMPSCQGSLIITDDQVIWQAALPGGGRP
jgi:hypothetical protein